MATPGLLAALPASLRGWLIQNLSPEDAESILAPGDPIRAWWTSGPGLPQTERLIELLVGARDHLTLLALVQLTRCRSDPSGLAPDLEHELAGYLNGLADHSRREVRGTPFDAVLAYSHRDAEPADLLGGLLREAGLRIFQDTDAIRPGDNILARLTDAIARSPAAILLITRHYLRSEWTRREYAAPDRPLPGGDAPAADSAGRCAIAGRDRGGLHHRPARSPRRGRPRPGP